MLKFATKLAPESDKCDRAHAAGFHHAEIWLNQDWLSRPTELLELTHRTPLRHVPHFPNHGTLTDAQLATAVSLCEAVGSDVMVIHKPMLRSYGRRLLSLNPSLALAVENGRQRGEQFRHWAEDHEWLTLDIEHVWKFTLCDGDFGSLLETVDAFLDRHGDQIRHVHLPGYVPGRPEHCPAYHNPALAQAIWSRLADFGYEGFVVSEANVEFQTDTHLRRDVILFDRWREAHTRSRQEVEGSAAAASA